MLHKCMIKKIYIHLNTLETKATVYCIISAVYSPLVLTFIYLFCSVGAHIKLVLTSASAFFYKSSTVGAGLLLIGGLVEQGWQLNR